ncbi:hypothetical protein KSC_056220 [Ktedonobacter sp. SOSP1-52]|nr:hypothetical protein KSC_056220 [Ktedonobacter sp. SOSP1-52]
MYHSHILCSNAYQAALQVSISVRKLASFELSRPILYNTGAYIPVQKTQLIVIQKGLFPHAYTT